MNVVTLPNVTGDGSAHPFSAILQDAKWVQFVVESLASAGAPARVGGPNVSAAIGTPILAAGAGQFFPQNTTDATDVYQLAHLYYFLPTGDKGVIMYGI